MEQAESELNKLDHYDLWKYISNDTAKVKDKLWTISSWLYALMSGLMGFIVKHYMEKGISGEQVGLVSIFILCGLGLSVFTCLMIWQYGLHVRSGWIRANGIALKIDGLTALTGYDGTLTEEIQKQPEQDHLKASGSQSLPPFARPLLGLAIAYGAGFLSILYFIILTSLTSQKIYLNMDTQAIINTVIAATIPLLILYFGHRLDKRKREEQEAKQAEEDKIERKHKARIQFELAAIFLGPQAGHYIAEVTIILHNKGLVRNVIDDLHLKVLGIKQDAKIGLLGQDEQNKGLEQIAKFPETFVDTNMLENKGSFFVEPGIVQQFTYVARIPEDIRFILVRSKFKYHEKSEHTAQKVFNVNPYKAPDKK